MSPGGPTLARLSTALQAKCSITNDDVGAMSSDDPYLPAPVAAFVLAVNDGDLNALVATFARHALVNDQLREYWDKDAIADWAARDIIGQRLSLRVRSVVTNHAQTALAAEVTGEFDRRGLPEPLVITFYFSSHESQLVQLVILRNASDT